MQKIVHNSCYSTLPIECVHDGHVGGPKQYNDFPLGNISFYGNICYCFSPPTRHTLYTYDRRRILKHVLKSYDIFCDAHDSRKRVIGLIKGRFRRYNFCLPLSHATSRAHAARVMQKVAHNSLHSTLPIPTIVLGFLKHVLKSYDIFCDVHGSRKRVVGLIYTKQFVS